MAARGVRVWRPDEGSRLPHRSTRRRRHPAVSRPVTHAWPAPAPLQGCPLEGLREEVLRALQLKGSICFVDIAGHEYHRDFRAYARDRLREFVAAHDRHDDVGEENVERVRGSREGPQRLLSVCGIDDRAPHALEQTPHHSANARLVLGQKDRATDLSTRAGGARAILSSNGRRTGRQSQLECRASTELARAG